MPKEKSALPDMIPILEPGKIYLDLLLVEDSETDAYTTLRAIREHMKCDCKVTHVRSMEEAERALGNGHTPDVILLDLGLPDTISEIDTYQRMNAARNNSPVIVLTGFSDHDVAVKMVDDGAADYVKKSVIGSDPETLCDSIAFTLCRIKKQRQLEEEKGRVVEEKDQYINWISGGYSVN